MLDLRTVLVVVFFSSVLQALAWVAVWLGWRELRAMRFFAAGFSSVAAGVFLMILRGGDPAPWHVLLDNSLIKLGLVLIAVGLARFLGQNPHIRLAAALMLAHVAMWGSALALLPEELSLRIHASTIITTLVMGYMVVMLARDRTQRRVLRWIMIGVLLEYIGGSMVQSVIEIGAPSEAASTAIVTDRNAWYLLQAHLFLVSFFACLLFMVSARLSRELRDKNEALLAEIAERKRLQLQLAASLQAEKTAREEQHQLMRMVSHEFRTPLAIVQRAGEMIGVLLEDAPAAVTQRLAGIDQAVRRLIGLIDRFLDADREGAQAPDMQPLALPALFAGVQQHFAAMGQGARLSLAPPPAIEGYEADADMLQTVLINLVDNALKYSAADAPVEISARVEGDALVLTVADRGIGIPDREQQSVGQRFYRASNTSAAPGVGIGLYNSRNMLAHHGAMLELRPREGGGTLAVVTLPRSGAALAEAAE